MAAQQATLTLMGLRSKRFYAIDVHAPDAAATQWTFNSTGAAAATSPNSYRIPEDCIIYDFSIAASPTATGAVLSNNNGVVIGGSLRYANQLATLVNRQKLNIPLKGGDFLSCLQHA